MKPAVTALLLLGLAALSSVCSAGKCGVPVVSSRIVGGADAVDGEWPWQVAVAYENYFLCGGSLISEQWVLSAAFGFKADAIQSKYKVYMGLHHLSESDLHWKSSTVEKILINSGYVLGNYGDIALIKLSNPVTFTDYIQPICLPSESVTFPSGTECWVTGWGNIARGVNLPSPSTLQKVKLPLMDYKLCDQMYHIGSSVSTFSNIIEIDKICAGYIEGGKDTCQADYGGPLVCQVNGVWIQAGIARHNQDCGLYLYRPGVYTMVSYYQTWIKYNIPEMTFSTVSILPVPPSVSSPPVCGSPVVSSRIGGGADAKYGEWPWQVAVVYDGVYRCGGSLISEQWVLSVAQCFNMEADTRRYMIFMGAHQFSSSNDHMKFSFVERIITHYRYESVTSKADIALVKLSNPVTYTDYVRPICLPSSSVTFPSGTECWVTGWGDVAYGVSLPNPKTLQEVKVHLIDYKECEQMYNTGSSVVYTIEKEMICAGYKEGGKASCQGDSGGPVVCKVSGAWIQAGIVSWMDRCALPNRPGVNTLVPVYQSWIKMCIPEQQFVTVTISSVSSTPSVPPVCGVPVVSSRIVGGLDAVYGEWPWQAAVYYIGFFHCGGSLINYQWVLSAAHCFNENPDKSKYDIYLGGYWETGGNTHLQSFNVEKLILDPQYVSVTSKGDIALVKLSSPVTFTDYVQPICLPSASVTFPSGMECWVTGWGDIAFAVSLPNPKTLQEVKIRLIDYKECDQLYNIGPSVDTAVNIQKEMICAGYKEGGKASCQGDSGGPVVCKVNGAWIQAGIVSFAQGCALPNRPGVNTLVPAYQSWIKTYIPEQQFVTVSIRGAAGSARAPWKNVLFCILFLSRVLN